MAFNISEFNATINQHGLQKGNQFRLRIVPPQGIYNEVLGLYGNIVGRQLEFYCRSVTLPELDITTAEVQHQGFGAISRRPQTMNFPILPVVFNVDEGMRLVKYFHRWSQTIINYDKGGGSYGNMNGQLPFEMSYKQDYATTVFCDVFDKAGNIVYTYEFGEAYPVNVGNVEVAWANNDEVLTLAVGFTYDVMKLSGSRPSTPARLGDRVTENDTVNEAVREITDDVREATVDDLIDAGIVGRLARKIFAPFTDF
jgi:hypothetical protein